jgi:hypothetical protein
MDLTAWVDVAIGITIVYLGTSLFVTIINEYVTQLSNLRGRQLCTALQQLIDDTGLKEKLQASPALKPFFDSQPRKAASYVDPIVLSQLLVGALVSNSTPAVGSTGTGVIEQVSNTIDKMPTSTLKTQLHAIVGSTANNTESLVRAVGEWADRSLTMLGERYKKWLQWISFGVGLIVAIIFNLDTVSLTMHLYKDKEARDAAVGLAVQLTERTHKETFDKCMALSPQERKADATCAPLVGLVDAVLSRNDTLGKLPIGWLPASVSAVAAPKEISSEAWLWSTRMVGWLLTAMAVSLGAPFWFDLLSRLVNVRYGMRKPEIMKDASG